MKKTLRQIAVSSSLSLAVFLSYSCKKEKLIPVEEGFTSFLADSTMKTVITATNNSSYYEFGLRFQVLKDGNVVKVGSRLPNAGTYRITIWDTSTKTVLITQNVSQSKSNVQAWANISNLSLQANKDYFISVIANNWKDAYPKNSIAVPYPIIKGNLKIMAFAYTGQLIPNASPKYPNIQDNFTSISGFIDFGFIPN